MTIYRLGSQGCWTYIGVHDWTVVSDSAVVTYSVAQDGDMGGAALLAWVAILEVLWIRVVVRIEGLLDCQHIVVCFRDMQTIRKVHARNKETVPS